MKYTRSIEFTPNTTIRADARHLPIIVEGCKARNALRLGHSGGGCPSMIESGAVQAYRAWDLKIDDIPRDGGVWLFDDTALAVRGEMYFQRRDAARLREMYRAWKEWRVNPVTSDRPVCTSQEGHLARALTRRDGCGDTLTRGEIERWFAPRAKAAWRLSWEEGDEFGLQDVLIDEDGNVVVTDTSSSYGRIYRAEECEHTVTEFFGLTRDPTQAEAEANMDVGHLTVHCRYHGALVDGELWWHRHFIIDGVEFEQHSRYTDPVWPKLAVYMPPDDYEYIEVEDD